MQNMIVSWMPNKPAFCPKATDEISTALQRMHPSYAYCNQQHKGCEIAETHNLCEAATRILHASPPEQHQQSACPSMLASGSAVPS